MAQNAKDLFTGKAGAYELFVSIFFYQQGLRAFFASSGVLRPGLRILDAGCGTGIVTFALIEALHCRNYDVQAIHGFDFTPVMLARFQERLDQRDIENVYLCQADALELEQLPQSWTNYDLVVSASMLEYVPKEQFTTALAALRSLLSNQGSLVLFITRRSLLTSLLIEHIWSANQYTKQEIVGAFRAAGFGDIIFRKFPPACFWLNSWGYIVEGKLLQERAAEMQGFS